MRGGKTGLGLMAGVALAIIVLAAWAWYDAGREAVGRISQPVAVPELAR